MKTKAFSLIEILIATIIFMTVVMMAVASFAMVKKSNEITNDQAKTDECSRQIEGFASSIFRSASVGDPVVMAVVRDDSSSKLLWDLSEIENEEVDAIGLNEEVDAIGFAVFEKAATDDQIILSVIFKDIDTDPATSKKTGYYYKSGSFSKLAIVDEMNLTSFLASGLQKIHSSVCVPLESEEGGVGFAGDFNNPFHLKLSFPYGGGPASQIGKPRKPIYTMVINDLLFSSLSDQGVEDKSISKLYTEVTNNIKSF